MGNKEEENIYYNKFVAPFLKYLNKDDYFQWKDILKWKAFGDKVHDLMLEKFVYVYKDVYLQLWVDQEIINFPFYLLARQ